MKNFTRAISILMLFCILSISSLFGYTVKVFNNTPYTITWLEMDYGGWCRAESTTLGPNLGVEFYTGACCPANVNFDVPPHKPLKYYKFHTTVSCRGGTVTLTEEKDADKKLKRLKATEEKMGAVYSDWIPDVSIPSGS